MKKKKLTECQKKAKRKKALTKKGGHLDKEWARAGAVGGHCEKCGKTEYLNAHHIFSRRNRSTRWDMANMCLLCSGCHVFSSEFSAHLTPTIFTLWIIDVRGLPWHENLRFRAGVPYKPSLQELEDLLIKLKEYD